jgi:VCBS repeat-containing protein
VLSNDSDADGNSLTVAVASGPAHGTVTLNANGGFTYAPAANYNGADSFTYTLSDGNGGTATGSVTVTITAVNDAPTISDTTDKTSIAGAALGPLTVTVGDVETAAGSLALIAASSNMTLVPVANIVFGGSGPGRTVTITPTAARAWIPSC